MAEKRSLKRTFARAAKRTGLIALFTLALAGSAGDQHRGPVVTPPAAVDTTMFAKTPMMSLGEEEKQPGLDITKQSYDQQLFYYNTLPNAGAPDLGKMTPEQRMQYYMKTYCFMQGGAAPAAQAQKDLFEALDALSRLTFLGKPLVTLADSGDLKFCGLDHLPSGIAAQFLPGSNAVVSGSFPTKEERVLKLAHEILHAAQHSNGLLSYEANWDIHSRVTRNLSIEAAAQAMEFMVAYEAKLAGDDSYWKHLQGMGGTTFTDKEIYRVIDATYNDQMANGATQTEALRHAGRAAWERVFHSDDWRNFYLNSELTNYIRDISEGDYKHTSGIAYVQFSRAGIDKAGKIGALESFTKDAQFPAHDAMMLKNQKMYWAYEAATIARYDQMPGGKSTADMLREAAAAGGNPYLDIDLAGVYRKSTDASWVKGQKFRYLYQIMDDMLKTPVPATPNMAAGPRAKAA